MHIDFLNWLDDLHIFDWLRPHDPPVGLTPYAGGAWAWFLMAILAIELAAAIAVAVTAAKREPKLFPKPLIAMLFILPILCCFQEAIGAWAGGLWYSRGTPLIVWTMIERPIPFWIVMVWFAAIPFGSLVIYRMVVKGTPIRTIFTTALLLGVLQMTLESIACNTGLMSYFGYYVTVLNIPPTQVVTVGFMYVFIGVALAYLVPWLQQSALGAWKWVLVLPTALGAYAVCLALGMPLMFLGAALHHYPILNWLAATLGVVFTIWGTLVLLRSRWVEPFRVQAKLATRSEDVGESTPSGSSK
jgi:hypothetical protein